MAVASWLLEHPTSSQSIRRLSKQLAASRINEINILATGFLNSAMSSLARISTQEIPCQTAAAPSLASLAYQHLGLLWLVEGLSPNMGASLDESLGPIAGGNSSLPPALANAFPFTQAAILVVRAQTIRDFPFQHLHLMVFLLFQDILEAPADHILRSLVKRESIHPGCGRSSSVIYSLDHNMIFSKMVKL